jgi:hypothetical protein
MAGKEDNRMHCSEFDALLSQAIDGTLVGERLTAFEAHGRECKLCGPLLQEAEAGHGWLKSLQEAEPPADLITNILLRTTGLDTARLHGRARPVTTSWMDRVRDWGATLVYPVVSVARQPRFAMSFGMAFFTLSVTLSLAGVKLGDLRHMDLRPSAIRRTYYETSGRVVKYYENIRFVYEIESRVREFKQATAPAEQPTQQQNNNNRDNNKDKEKDKSNTSGQPEPRQERNYSQEGNQPVVASLPHDPPVVSVTTYRRLS